ncbi:hypothetical protein L209DRAFT_747773 [Thermothelomyces heterothallicus CBS 203.75]
MSSVAVSTIQLDWCQKNPADSALAAGCPVKGHVLLRHHHHHHHHPPVASSFTNSMSASITATDRELTIITKPSQKSAYLYR